MRGGRLDVVCIGFYVSFSVTSYCFFDSVCIDDRLLIPLLGSMVQLDT